MFSFDPFDFSTGSTLPSHQLCSAQEIRDVPGKGLGAVAVRDLAEGELVIEERPPPGEDGGEGRCVGDEWRLAASWLGLKGSKCW